MGFQYSVNQLEKLVIRIKKLQPDMVIFTGDLMDTPNEYNESEKIAPILRKLNAPFGKFAVYGNHDQG